MRRALALVLACSSSADPPPPAAKPAPADAAVAKPDRWGLTVVAGADLRNFMVEFSGGGGTLVLGKTRVPLTDVTFTDQRIAFTIVKPKQPGSDEHFTLTRTGDRADGADTLGGDTTMPVRMYKLGEHENVHSAYPRPQTPKPPFPYAHRELDIDAPDGAKLAGTLVTPTGAGPFPIVLLLSGSGQEDRDETIFGHKPYLVIADKLARAGIASYRFDDRGTGRTKGDVKDLDTEIADAGAIVDVLAKLPEIDPKRIGIIGHSAAGHVAPNVALKHPIAFVVLLAGTTLSGRAYAAYQTEHELKKSGATEAQLAEQRDMQARITEAALHGPDAVRAALTAALTPKLEKALGHKPSDAELAQAIAKPLAETTNPWIVSYFRIDPRDAWKKLSIPVLLMVGDKDTQIPAAMTIAALDEATGKRATTRELPGLNHLFQHANTGEVDEYLTIEETFAPEALDLLATWIGEHTK